MSTSVMVPRPAAVRAALETIYAARCSANTLHSTTPRTLRQLLEREHGLAWSADEWNASKSAVVRAWQQILEDNREVIASSSPPIVMVVGSSKTLSATRASNPERECPTKKHKQSDTTRANEIVLSSSDRELDDDEKEDRVAKPRSSTKYDRMAAKNLGSFLNMALGGLTSDLLGGGTNNDDEGPVEELLISDSSSTTRATRPPVTSRPQPKGAKAQKPRTSAASAASTASTRTETVKGKVKGKGKAREKETYKSTEFVHESDDSSHEVLPMPTEPESGKSFNSTKRKSEVGVITDGYGEEVGYDSESEPTTVKGKGKSKVKDKGKEQRLKRARVRKDPVKKEGDAEKGSAAEEERIKKLKALLRLAGTPRPFTAQTGAERSLSVQARLSTLSNLLNELGLTVGNNRMGRLPSESRAKEVGDVRELEKETEALKGTNTNAAGLRTGKIRQRPGDSPDESDDNEDRHSGARGLDQYPSKGGHRGEGGGRGTGTPQRKKLEEMKKFASFLGDQSESD